MALVLSSRLHLGFKLPLRLECAAKAQLSPVTCSEPLTHLLSSMMVTSALARTSGSEWSSSPTRPGSRPRSSARDARARVDRSGCASVRLSRLSAAVCTLLLVPPAPPPLPLPPAAPPLPEVCDAVPSSRQPTNRRMP